MRQVGLLLPYTGLHHLLLRGVDRPLVLTSGNLSEEPIALTEVEARVRLGGIADGFLHHNRRIRSRYEDSVTGVVDGAPMLLRRGRGYAPEPLAVPIAAPEPVLAVGAQAKHTFTVLLGSRAYVASHTGDLDDYPTFTAFDGNLAHLTSLLDAKPTWVAHDLHPGYLSTQFAVGSGQGTGTGWDADRRIAVQHHHAHIASCAAEHGICDPVIGIALDGLGMGDDGTLWGGEILLADLTGYRRVGRFLRAPLPGGAAAVRQPWRMVLGYLHGAEGGAWCEPDLARRLTARFDPATAAVIERQVARGLNSPVASSAGRLFDAASCILGLRDVAAYEGEAAIVLEQVADPAERDLLPYAITSRDGLDVFDPRPTLAALIAGVSSAGDRSSTATSPLAPGVPVLAARFHNTVAVAVARLATSAARRCGVTTVCVSGGVFANARLLTQLTHLLTSEGLTVLRNERLPAGDGGISYGQAAVAAARMASSGNRASGDADRVSSGEAIGDRHVSGGSRKGADDPR